MVKSLERKIDLISRNLEEILTLEDLKILLKNKEPLRHYIGFEISGRIHLGSGLISMMKIADFQQAGVETNVFLADWHSWINEKLGEDFEKIQKVAKEYYIPAFKLSIEAVGGKSEKLNFILGSELYKDFHYWLGMIDVAKNTTLARIQRSIDILGRKEGEKVDFAKLIYPVMQVADIFALKINLAHSGTDQRKAHVIARDTAFQLKFNPLLNKKKHKIKPVALHHHLILGLQKPPIYPIPKDKLKELKTEMKMSKSKPYSAIFIDDSTEEIENKIKKAFCPPKETEYNPILDWIEWLVFPLKGKIKVLRPAKFGGPKIYRTIDELKKDYQQEKIHPLDLKETLTEFLIDFLKPLREKLKEKRNLF